MEDFGKKIASVGGRQVDLQKMSAPDCKELACQCGSILFEPVTVFKIIPAEKAKDKQEHLSEPQCIYICKKCEEPIPSYKETFLYKDKGMQKL